MSDCVGDWREARFQGEALWHTHEVDGGADNSGKIMVILGTRDKSGGVGGQGRG